LPAEGSAKVGFRLLVVISLVTDGG